MTPQIRLLQKSDCPIITAAFTAIGWDKPQSQYERYVAQQTSGDRKVYVAEVDGEFAGYGCVVWVSGYEHFRDAGIPEIVDLNVLPQFRRNGIASMIMDTAEAAIAERAAKLRPGEPVIAGIGVGLYPDYGPAQRMYVRRGYVPDARGVAYDGTVLDPMAETVNDDSLNLHLTKRLL